MKDFRVKVTLTAAILIVFTCIIAVIMPGYPLVQKIVLWAIFSEFAVVSIIGIVFVWLPNKK